MSAHRLNVKVIAYILGACASGFSLGCQQGAKEEATTAQTLVQKGSNNRLMSHWKIGPKVKDIEGYACFYFGTQGNMSNARSLYPNYTNWSSFVYVFSDLIAAQEKKVNQKMDERADVENKLNACSSDCAELKGLYNSIQAQYKEAKEKVESVAKQADNANDAIGAEFVLDGTSESKNILISKPTFDFIATSLSALKNAKAIDGPCKPASEIFENK